MTTLFYGREESSHPGVTTGAGDRFAYLVCLYEDDLEQNDTRATETNATSFQDGIPPYSRWVQATIFPAGDDDWYKVDADLEGLYIDLFSGSDSPRSSMDVYKNGTQVATGVQSFQTDASAATWEVRIHGDKRDLYNVYFDAPGPVTSASPGPAANAWPPANQRIH